MASEQKLAIPGFASFTSGWHSSPYDAISPLRPELSAKGRSVVVTGGGSGIGKAIARAFAQAGASSVAVIGRRADRLEAAISEISAIVGESQTLLLYETADLTNRRDAKNAFSNIAEKQGGKIDILVSNAGDIVIPTPALDADEDELMKAFDYNVRIPLNTVHAFLPHATEKAILLNISSGIAHMKPVPGLSAHGMGKAAGVRLMEYIQVENPRLHLVNVQPGSVATEMSAKVGNPNLKDDVNLPGHFCVWLASPEANFLNGKFVWSNWDVGEMIARAGEIKNSRLLSIMLEGVPM